MKNGILLIAGLVVTALYVIFSMQIYELLYLPPCTSSSRCKSTNCFIMRVSSHRRCTKRTCISLSLSSTQA